ncbi:MAG: hypothetical protein EP343_25570 [Deltaproteobacteria bacterium]|nr:MAG: hypothetical protein EP343_25570 [Deltaproteobacteria bacterium]
MKRKPRILKMISIACAMMVFWTSWASMARIKLTTLPQRNKVEIQLDNGSYTLVEEVRIVPLLPSTPQRGHNKIDFSWSNTSLNKDTILFRPVAIRQGKDWKKIGTTKRPDGSVGPEVEVLNVSYPPGENALVWEVYAAKACAVKVRVSYLIKNLTRTFSYRALANQDETKLTLRQYVRIFNNSGEDFGWANFWIGFDTFFRKNIEQQSSLKILAHRFKQVPIEKTYTFDWYKHGKLNTAKPNASKVLMHYVLRNDKKNGLGKFPLEAGKVRIFIQDKQGSQAFLGEDRATLTPLDGKMKLYIGQARDILCKRFIETNKRHHIRGNLYNQEIVIRYEIQNFKDKPATLQIREQLQRLTRQYFGSVRGDVEWKILSKSKGYDALKGQKTNNPVLSVNLDARSKDKDAKVAKKVIRLHLMLKNLW